jgi:hypothetical protein
MTAAELEAARPLRKPGDTDAVTFSWADPEAELYGLVRLATGLTADGSSQPSALAIAFSGRQPLGVIASAGDALPATATVDVPLERWSVRGDGDLTFELEFQASTAPAEYGGKQRVAKAGGLEGYDQLCTVEGTLRVGGQDRAVHGLAQRGHAWGNPDWDAIALTRSVGAWFEDGSGAVLHSVRGGKVSHHGDEAYWAARLDAERAVGVEEPRLSTTTDEAGRQIRSALELWVTEEDEYPFRSAGEVLTGSTLELGALRLDCAFFRWHADGRTGVGRYDVIRRA